MNSQKQTTSHSWVALIVPLALQEVGSRSVHLLSIPCRPPLSDLLSQGGGHSLLSPTLGLGVDRALQFKVVTPSGEYLIANACQNSDLFFALSGGGGGTFGVVMETTFKVEPKPISIRVYALIRIIHHADR
jgi:hypothetical protein